MHLTYDHTHHCSPCDRGSPVTLGGLSEARHSLVYYNTVHVLNLHVYIWAGGGGGGDPIKPILISKIAKWVFLTFFVVVFLGLNLKNDVILIFYLK